MILNCDNYEIELLKYKNNILNTSDFVNIFGTNNLINRYKKDKRLGGKDKNTLLKKASIFCNIDNIDKGKYVFTEIYNNIYFGNITEHPLYFIYHSMKQRCYNINIENYNNYGGRGIDICAEWLDKKYGLLNFIKWSEDNDYIPNKDLSIDRIDNDKGYSPDNCRWTVKNIQMLNRRSLKRNTDIYEESRIELFNNLYLTNLYFNGHIYPVGTFKTKEEASIAKNNLRTYLVNKLVKEEYL